MILLACDGLFLEWLHMVFSLALYISNESVRLAGDFTFGRQVHNNREHITAALDNTCHHFLNAS